ncbi:hypothetical protein TanjilG_06168 [Lupinus angustifolius]|uniref:LOB domain-containing protein n=1 Tax=Lupinus angustifolius TaxID=3871 RepID=A0A394DPL7_LUPAN|nr:PREDICTED: LOB domain-containing protein 36-like [Lupinus angustifolius]XP_019433269.1 PREDICTED: LOB domain-containing protein 36-like [Lupinus angustifolius]OIW21541.1 hypothetical protein TanjilG_06168 [Lupinus angustifolius]
MSSSNSPCAACKFLRRKCTQECPFAPYFPPDNPQRFSCVHRVFGASNVAKLLNELNPSQREDAVKSLAYEAEARLRDPVYGCIGYISVLQHKLRQIQANIHSAKKELSTYLNPQAMQALQAMLENPNMIQPNGLVMPQQHQMGNPFQANIGFSPYGNTNVMVAPHNQMAIGDQRQDLLEAQQLAAEQEFLRLNGLEGMGGSGGDNGFNQMGVGPELALGTFDNVGPYEIQQQQGEHHHHHQHHVEEQLLLLPQQTQPQEHQLSLQQPQGGDRRSVGP